MNITPLSTKQIESLVLLAEESSELSSELISVSLSNPDMLGKVEIFETLDQLLSRLPVLRESIDFLSSCNFLINQSNMDSSYIKEFSNQLDQFIACLRDRPVAYNLSELAIESLTISRKLQSLNNTACKCLRHGFDSYHPLDAYKTKNIESLLSGISTLLPRLADFLSNLELVMINSSLLEKYSHLELKSEFFTKKLKYLHYLEKSDI